MKCSFFDKDIVEVCEYLADKGIRVMVAGLDKDFRGESFGVMPELLTRAEFVTKLTAVCAKCGAPATRTQRLVNGKPAGFEDPIVMVGADEVMNQDVVIAIKFLINRINSNYERFL